MPLRTVIGVDCATSAKNVGLCRAQITPTGVVLVEEPMTCSPGVLPAEVLAGWISERPDSLLALDAPLGWPAPLGSVLSTHSAGQPIDEVRSQLFDRTTDKLVYQRYGVKPLSVGADKIARTAHATVGLLGQLRLLTGCPIPLAWNWQLEQGPAVIEVYPAATLAANGLPYRGKLKFEAAAQWISQELKLPAGTDLAEVDKHAFDSLICLIAGVDFLLGRACPPAEHTGLAQREGWIWIRSPIRAET